MITDYYNDFEGNNLWENTWGGHGHSSKNTQKS